MQGGEKYRSRETDETEGWIKEKLSRKVGGDDRVSEGRNEKRARKGRWAEG